MSEHPKAHPPADDVLSDVLRAVRLTGAVFFAVDATAPWALEGPALASNSALIRRSGNSRTLHLSL